MQHIGTDMDDLFKRASENYPLKTDNSDWEKVLAALKKDDDDPGVLIPVRTGINRMKYLWLLLLIPIGLLVAKFSFNNNADKGPGISETNKISESKDTKQEQAGKESNEVSIQNNNSAIPNASANDINKNSVSKSNYTAKSSLNETNTKAELPISGVVKNLKDLTDANINLVAQNNDVEQLKKSQPINDNNIQMPFALTPAIADSGSSNDLVEKPILNQNSLLQSQQEKDQTVTLTKPKRFYMGIIVSPDITTVKFQSIKKVGLNFGILAGYKLNSRLNAELGVLLDSKYYYTDAKYLDKAIVKKDVLNLQSFSSITEVPINLRYNFKPGKSSQYFASAGVVSYIIHNERYNYVYDKDGTLQQGEKQYTKASSNWFSNMQISAGYEHTLGKLGDFRIEPYYRIPLTGVGVGNVPITSVGVNIGIIKKLK